MIDTTDSSYVSFFIIFDNYINKDSVLNDLTAISGLEQIGFSRREQH